MLIHAFSLSASHFVSCTVEVPFWPPCFYWFFGSCFGGHDEAGLLAFEALQGLPRPARGTHGSLKVAAHVLVKPWFAAPPPCTFHCFVRKVKKMPIEDIHLALAPNPRVLLGSCAPSSAVSVAGGWWVAAVGFVVVLQRYRSCGSWACPGGLVSGWTWCWGSHLGVPCGLDLKSQSLVIESFSVGSRAVLSTMGEGFGGSRFKVLYGPSF